MTDASLRAAWRRAPLRHVVVPDVVDPAEARAVRARVAPTLAAWDVPDRGRFALSEAAPRAALFERLRALATRVTGRRLRVGRHRWTRLRHGDYALVLADLRLRTPGTHVEVLLDLSPAATGAAEVVYLDRDRHVVVGQQPGTAVLVGRRPTTWRFDRYLSARVGAAEVWRLRLALVPADRAGSGSRRRSARGRASRSRGRGGR
jgi:hypothetical protein